MRESSQESFPECLVRDVIGVWHGNGESCPVAFIFEGIPYFCSNGVGATGRPTMGGINGGSIRLGGTTAGPTDIRGVVAAGSTPFYQNCGQGIPIRVGKVEAVGVDFVDFSIGWSGDLWWVWVAIFL